MSIIFGQSGEVALKRITFQAAIETEVNSGDINTGLKRFSFENSAGSLITGDRVIIKTDDDSNLTLVQNHNHSNGQWFVNVDPVGGIRFYNSFSEAVEGLTTTALSLVQLGENEKQKISIRVANDSFRHVAGVKNFEMTTSRDQIDLTNLGGEFKDQYESGLMSGQGSMECIWEHDYKTGDRKNEYGKDSEFPFYLAQLLVRIKAGSTFDGRFYVYRDPNNSARNVYYEATCNITNVALNIAPTEVVETRIEFVTNGEIRLKIGDSSDF
tara:strand:- start:307 stop:1113 length:807 start_codon:yes stop_codon:yes gene_type:complete